MINIGVLVSGGGTNLQAIINAIDSGILDAKICVVISNQPEAFALERAKKHNIPVAIVERNIFPDREDYDRKVVDILRDYEVELVCLAGFMRILSPVLIDAFPMSILNIHPALLPAFPGLKVQKKAIEHGVKFSGATVHLIDEGVDTGPIVIQAVVPIYDNDSEDTLSARILKEEHRIYPQAIQLFSEGRISIVGRRVSIHNATRPEGKMENPEVEIFV